MATMKLQQALHIIKRWYLQQGFTLEESQELAAEDVEQLRIEVMREYPNLGPLQNAAQVTRLARKRHPCFSRHCWNQ